MAKLRLGIIYGGRSGEHEVSVLSANSVIGALDPNKYEVFPIGITKQGNWLPGQAPGPLVASANLQVRQLEDEAAPPSSLTVMENRQGQILAGLRERVEVIFPVLHGPYGEDGTIQGLLELAGIPYVGAGVLAAAVGMDKALMKAVFQQQGLPVGEYRVYLRSELVQQTEVVAAEIEARLGYPCFVKPANLGSSVGISKAHDRTELRRALQLAAEYDRKIVVEATLTGREIECSVLGNDQPQSSVPGEIIPGAEFYDYEAKYIKQESQLIIPAELPSELATRIQELAVRAFKAIDCAGLARVDFFVNVDQGQIYVNEINTLPGFTKISMYPKLWEASGISYSKLIDRLIELAQERFQDKQCNRVE